MLAIFGHRIGNCKNSGAAACHGYGDYGQLDSLYRKAFGFAAKKGLRIGDVAYEASILNEIALRESEKCLVRVAVPIG